MCISSDMFQNMKGCLDIFTSLINKNMIFYMNSEKFKKK